MKTRLAVVALFAAAVLVYAAPAQAITSVDIFRATAAVTTGGAKASNVSVVLKAASDPIGGATKTEFDWSGVTPPATGWKISDTVAVMVATVTDANGAVRIYTENTLSTATPRYVGAGDPAGILLDDGTGTTDTTLSLAWSVKAATRTIDAGDVNTGIGAADPNTGPTGAVRDNKFQWLFLLDRLSGAFSDTNKFTWTHNATGIHFGQADTEFAVLADGLPSYLYLEANFTSAAALQAYKTSTVTIESFLE